MSSSRAGTCTLVMVRVKLSIANMKCLSDIVDSDVLELETWLVAEIRLIVIR